MGMGAAATQELDGRLAERAGGTSADCRELGEAAFTLDPGVLPGDQIRVADAQRILNILIWPGAIAIK